MGNSSSHQKITEHDVSKYPEASSSGKKVKGIATNRFCTDVLFGVILIGSWVLMTLIGWDAMKEGDPYRLIGPSNSDGKICGYDTELENTPYLYTVTETGSGVCVNECPLVSIGSNSDPSNYICLDSISDVVYPVTSTYISSMCFSNGVYDPALTLSTCSCNLILPTTNVLRRCYFDDPNIRSLYANQATPSFLTEFFSDCMEVWHQILIFGCAVSLFLAFFFSHFLKYENLILFMTWFSIFSIVVLSIGCSYLAYITAQDWEKLEGSDDVSAHTENDRKLLQYASYAGIIFAFLFACSMIYLRKAIRLAIKAMSLASKCIEKMPLIIFTPIGQCCAFLTFIIPTAYYTSFLVSQGTFEKTFFENPIDGTSTGVVSGLNFTFDNSSYIEEKMWFLFFVFLWTTNFIISIGFLIIALSSAQWYFTKPSERDEKISNRTIWESYWIVFRYHTGTVAFGSFLVAFVQFLRVFVMYIINKFKKLIPTDNLLGKCLVWYVVQCVETFLLCLEKCVKFINKNGFIQTAIHGSSFCTSVKNAFFIIARNICRIGSVAFVSGLCLIIMKICVTCISSSAFYYILITDYADIVSGPITITILVMVLSWSTVTMFTDVYHATIDTIIMCYITDEESNGLAEFAGEGIGDFIEANGKLKNKNLDDDDDDEEKVDEVVVEGEENQI